jgi:adhesin transport system outer membrane protein
MFKSRVLAASIGLLLASTFMPMSKANAMSLREAIAIAVESNPEIGQAVENREAIEFELRQAKGLYLPSIDLDASTGVRGLDNPTRRSLSLDDDPLYPNEVGLMVTQKLWDGGARRAELDRQAARVDSAAFRVLERSEAIALQIVREYMEYMLQQQIIAESRRNVQFHQKIVSDIDSMISGGTLTEADRQQARERLLGAKAKLKETEETLEAVKASFYRLVGKHIDKPSMPKSVAKALPKSLENAIETARIANARIKIANADIDVADTQVKAARSAYSPEVFAEGGVRTGIDIDGADGRSTYGIVRLVAKWNLYRGGIDVANEQEQIRRASEQRLVLHQAHREVEEAVRISWDRRIKQNELANMLRQQSAANGELVDTYREQLSIGQRSLLDVLGAQNTRYNVSILSKTAEYASRFAEYRILAATGTLLSTLELRSPTQSEAYARAAFNVKPTQETETYGRTPSRQDNNLPLDLLAPLKK